MLTFMEAKAVSIAPTIFAWFIGIVHEVAIDAIHGKWGMKRRGRHLRPTLVAALGITTAAEPIVKSALETKAQRGRQLEVSVVSGVIRSLEAFDGVS
jgi:hypothetical protein